MSFDRLLAKSLPPSGGDALPVPPSVYLPGHLRDVYDAGRQLLDCTADQQLAALGLQPVDWSERLRRVVLLAAALHDLGKANNHFQEMVRRERIFQGLRHEWVTLVLLQQDGWREWLSAALAVPDDDWYVLLWCIAGHHPAYHRPSPPGESPAGAGVEMRLVQDHADFHACMEWFREVFRIGTPPSGQLGVLQLTGLQSAFVTLKRLVCLQGSRWDQMDPAPSALSRRQKPASSAPTSPGRPCRGAAWRPRPAGGGLVKPSPASRDRTSLVKS